MAGGFATVDCESRFTFLDRMRVKNTESNCYMNLKKKNREIMSIKLISKISILKTVSIFERTKSSILYHVEPSGRHARRIIIGMNLKQGTLKV